MHQIYKEVPKGITYNFDEACPHCDKYICVVIDNNDFTHYTVTCPYCGEKMMLCTLCRWDFWDNANAECPCGFVPIEGCNCIIEAAEKGLATFPPRVEG